MTALVHPTTAVAAQAVGVTKTYGLGTTAVRALDDLSVEVPAGRFTAVMGPSGSGKSTLMHCLAGLDRVDSGRITVAGVEVTGLDERSRTLLRRDRIGFVFQSFNLVPSLTARENVVLPLTLAGRRPDQAWIDTLVDALDLRERLDHRPDELSGGQQQRVAVARALATRPALVFADEPTGNLDSRHGRQLLELLAWIVAEHAQTVVMVTHDPGAARYADEVVFLADGRIVDALPHPTTDGILARMARLETPATAPLT